MKFPSIFRTASPMRYDIKPRYYDPVKEEIEQRTARIKRELEEEGMLESSGESGRTDFGSGIRGSFTQYKGIKQRDTSLFSSTAMIRTLLFLGMIMLAFGYIYMGNEIFVYFLYAGLIVAGVFFIFRLKNQIKKDE